MDLLDLNIIMCLQEDGRMSITDISKKVNLSRPSVSERLHKLQEQGIIVNFKALIDPQHLGYPITYYVSISEIIGSVDAIVKILSASPFVTEVHCITGNTNYIAKAHATSIQQMHTFLSELIRFCKVESAIVLNSPVPLRSLQPSNPYKTSE